MDKPWRADVAEDWSFEVIVRLMKQILKRHEIINKLITPEEKERSLTVLLIGPSGHGKSSLINGLYAALENQLKERAIVKTQSTHATYEFRQHQPRLPSITKDGDIYAVEEDIDTKNFSLSFADFVGIDAGDHHDFRKQCIGAMLGMIPGGQKIKKISPDTISKVEKEMTKEKIEETTKEASAIIWVFEVETIGTDVSHLPIIADVATRQGIPQALALTKVDKLDRSIKENPRQMYFTSSVRETVQKISDLVGVPIYRTFPIMNYVDTFDVTPQMSYQYLYMLQFIMADIEGRLRRMLYNSPVRKHQLNPKQQSEGTPVLPDDVAQAKAVK